MVVQISWFKKSCWKWQTFCQKLNNKLHPENSTCEKARSYPVLKSSFGAHSTLRAATAPVFQSSELSQYFLMCCTTPHPLLVEKKISFYLFILFYFSPFKIPLSFWYSDPSNICVPLCLSVPTAQPNSMYFTPLMLLFYESLQLTLPSELPPTFNTFLIPEIWQCLSWILFPAARNILYWVILVI